MTGPYFVDTNVLLYAEDNDRAAKRDRARALIGQLLVERSGRISLQVLNEFFAAGTKKLGLDAVAARRRIELYSRFDVVSLAVDDLLAAVDLHRLHQLSIWDALIVRAALVAGCKTLLTEDLQHGFRVDGLEVVDPFRD
jgi:predicted nucleic acid-binding protein